ncbi:MBL fold metallo-hydrolase [Nonomuraea sediminis]|uniref:MBL fold metallo-hydrolase n=1 Tax=Nonomuraea sediminis TaxID=2835864 RepID=UPI001BDCE743|nr:MBL fold metallo-hydrolase [Nonomuraea sediminis]
MSLTLTRVVHSCVLLDFDGVTFLTDPWFSERRGYLHGEPLACTPDKLPELAGVLATHGHYDHYDLEAFAAYPSRDVPMVVKRGIGDQARDKGYTHVVELDAWESVEIAGARITAAPARHAVPQVTFVVEKDGTTVFFGGDTMRIPELDEVARRFPEIDLALMPVNGLYIRPALNRQVVMNAEEAAELTAVLRPRVAVPIHYAFTAGRVRDRLLLGYDGTPERFAAAVPEGIEVRVLATGEPLTI